MYIMGEEEVAAVRRVIMSGQLFRYRGGEGGETDQFEKAWSEKIGVQYTVSLTSGTAALICAMVGLNIGPGDEVIVPGYTFMATAIGPLGVGAVPIIAEVDESLTIDPVDVERKITQRTKAIIPVHMNGLPCNMDAIMAIANKHGIAVVEDACQADGGSYKGKRLGSIGKVGAFSFNHFKIIACGEGGAMVTSDQVVFERALIHHDSGCVFRDHADQLGIPFFAGWNFRMNEILAAILRVQLDRLDGILAALRAEKRLLMSEIAGESAFTFNPIHDPDGDCGTTLWLYFESAGHARSFVERMGELGVTVGSPIDSGRHVYTNWEPVMEKRGSSHPGRDAYQLAQAPVGYSKDMCPHTLTYLARTVGVGMNPTRTPEQTRELAATIKKAASMVTV